jgi:formylglycine-generating enzyme required for sulfatase activity
VSTKILGDYNVIKQIGHGSLGTVHLAEHRFMKRQYVLKMLPEELSSDRSFVQRFEEEVKILSSLDHPHIVKIHNVSFAQGIYFLVTDCIVDPIGETTNLTHYMNERGKRLSEEELFRLLRQLASALDYAHKRQQAGEAVAHRGLKPNNVLVGKGRGGVNFYLSDFGLSRIIGSGAVLSRTYKVLADTLGVASSSSKTAIEKYSATSTDSAKLSILHQSFLQSFAFLAPEQKQMEELHQVDYRADVYAFGVLTYYLITGIHPEGVFEPAANFAPEYQWAWDSFIHNCMQYAPAKRPASIESALLELNPSGASQLFLAEEVTQSSEQPLPEKQEAAPVSELAPLDIDGIKKLQSFSAGEKIQERIRSELTVTHYRPEVSEVKQIEPLLTEMVTISEDKYIRGSNQGSRDENPRHSVVLNSFAIDIHPVTNEQFIRFIEFNGGEKDSQNHDMIRLRETRIKRASGKLTIESGYAKHPVIGVTWYGAVAYAKWIGKRLPTEAEWEIAAYGGIEGAMYPTGDEIEKSEANFFSSDTTAVKSYASNGYGLFDMAGNVYEWCQDWYDYTYYEHSAQEPDNPQGPIQGVYRVLRGGCWKSLKDDLRCAHRHRNNPGTINRTYGFRCAADVEIAN